jgi:hypothetical protein
VNSRLLDVADPFNVSVTVALDANLVISDPGWGDCSSLGAVGLVAVGLAAVGLVAVWLSSVRLAAIGLTAVGCGLSFCMVSIGESSTMCSLSGLCRLLDDDETCPS